MASALLHVAGYVTGAILYSMLLAMVLNSRSGDRLTVGAALLGLAWNLGELLGDILRAIGAFEIEAWVAATSFAALGFLPAVVIHSVARSTLDGSTGVTPIVRRVTALAYGSASVAALLHLAAAARGQGVPDPRSLVLLTASLVLLAPVLLWATSAQTNARRAMWMTALAVFAVSALHVGNFHGPRESWTMELLGHHASIPLAFALLYQDYRFALADLFLKQAISLMLVVGVVFGFWSLAGPRLIDGTATAGEVGLLLALWVGSSFLFPILRGWVTRFVDRVVLRREDDRRFLDNLASTLQSAATEEQVLEAACAALRPALNATETNWAIADGDAARPEVGRVLIPTTEAPTYALHTARLAGGRRLLSGDLAMLDRMATLVGRRIDAIRLTAERYERALREGEMRSLATEAELRALRAQINPHFLFNALTTIGFLIREAPSRAVNTLVQLTTLLRGVLRTEGEFTTLSREMSLITCYLDIERERFEDRLRVSVDIAAAAADIRIPALVVQPLVENAVKHGVAAAHAGGVITITARRLSNNILAIEVRNTGAPLRPRTSDEVGIGLHNVERRLAMYYGTAASLTLAATEAGETVATLRIPIAERPKSSQPPAPRPAPMVAAEAPSMKSRFDLARR